MKSVYTCDDYHLVEQILTIQKPKLAAMVTDIESFNRLVAAMNYSSIVCPELLVDEFGNKPKIVILN